VRQQGSAHLRRSALLRHFPATWIGVTTSMKILALELAGRLQHGRGEAQRSNQQRKKNWRELWDLNMRVSVPTPWPSYNRARFCRFRTPVASKTGRCLRSACPASGGTAALTALASVAMSTLGRHLRHPQDGQNGHREQHRRSLHCQLCSGSEERKEHRRSSMRAPRSLLVRRL
jgi:hypothetical protein